MAWPDPSWFIPAAAALMLFAVALFDQRLLNDGDTYWHLAAGGWMLDHGFVPSTDPFSLTRLGAPWRAHEWLSEVVMAQTFRLGGWSGVAILYGAALMTVVALLATELRRWFSGPRLVLALALTLAPMTPNLLARPHVLVLPLLIGWTVILLRARAADRAPPLWAALLMLLWANLHGSFVFGALLLAAFGLEALLAAAPGRRWRVIRDWALFGCASLLCAAITPQGPEGLIFPFKLMGMTSLAGVDEWRPMDFTQLGPFEISLAVVLFVGLFRGAKVPAIRLLLFLGLVHMALQHNRHAMVAAPVAALVLAAPLADALGQDAPKTKPAGAPAWLMVAVAVALLAALRLGLPFHRADGPTTPGAAIDHVPAGLRSAPVLNDYGFGGYLIFRGVRPFVDGRTDLFGDAFMRRYYRIVAPDAAALDQTLRENHIAWTIFPPASPAETLMAARPGWRQIYADQFAVVRVKDR